MNPTVFVPMNHDSTPVALVKCQHWIVTHDQLLSFLSRINLDLFQTVAVDDLVGSFHDLIEECRIVVISKNAVNTSVQAIQNFNCLLGCSVIAVQKEEVS